MRSAKTIIIIRSITTKLTTEENHCGKNLVRKKLPE